MTSDTPPTELAVVRQSSALSAENLPHTLALADTLARSDLLPAHFAKKPQNCLIALALAQSLNINPIMALQQVSVISGKPCLQSTLMISLLKQSGKIRGPLRFIVSGDDGQPNRGCRAVAIDSETGEEIEGENITLALAQREGWTRNAKYKSMPDTMLKWRAAAFFIRTYYPEVVLGLHTAEEMEDVKASGQSMGNDRRSAAEQKLEQLRAEREVNSPQSDPEHEPETRVIDADPPDTEPPKESPPMPQGEADKLTDFMTAVAEATDPDELTVLAGQCSDFDGVAAKRAAKRAVMEQAKLCRFVWSEDARGFVTEGYS